MRIVSLNGLLGYGYTLEGLEIAMSKKVDYVGVDAGSTDPGPYYLGHGKSFTNRSAVKRDIELALPLALKQKAPFIIGTAGGSGGNIHVDWVKSIIIEIAEEQDLSFNMLIVKTEVTPEYVIEKLRSGKVINLSDEFDLTEEAIRECTRIVTQVGVEPFLKALTEYKELDVLLVGRSCDTAIYAAPAILNGMDPGLAFHMGKIMECGTMCAEPLTGADVLVAEIEKDAFILEPANPIRRSTIHRVAAHTMYEQSSPFTIKEPGGYVDLTDSTFEQISDRAVRVKNSKYFDIPQKTLKIEGSKLEGYRTISIGKINDIDTIKRIDTIFNDVKEFLKENLSDKYNVNDYTITLRKYGDALPGHTNCEPTTSLGIVLDVVGKTQQIANHILSLSRTKILHTDYPGRKCSAGNVAFAYSPSDIECGPVYTFAIYHLVEVDDLGETAVYEYIKVGKEDE